MLRLRVLSLFPGGSIMIAVFLILLVVLVGVCAASYPTAKVHRPSRRKLGRGQYVQPPPVTVVLTSTADTATMTFSQPVVVNGTIAMTVSGGRTLVTQTVVSPTVVTQLFSGTLTTQTWSIPAGQQTVKTFQGGQLAPASGTFS